MSFRECCLSDVLTKWNVCLLLTRTFSQAWLLSPCIGNVHKTLAKTYNYLCHLFIQLVEDFTSHWQVPLPQLRILQRALCYFAQASTSFPSNCDHVLDTLSSLALWVHNFLIWYSHPVNFIIIKLVKRVLKNLCTNYCLFYHTVNTLLVQHTGY